MAKTAKCPICLKWHPLSSSGALVDHAVDTPSGGRAKCPGSGASPLPNEPKAPPTPAAKPKIEAAPQETPPE